MSDSPMHNIYKTTSSHTSALAEQNNGQAQTAVGDIQGTMLWIQDGDSGLGVAVNYSHIEEIDTDSHKQRVRLYLPRALVDVTTDNIAELIALISRRKLATLSTGHIGESITVSAIAIYNHENPPPTASA